MPGALPVYRIRLQCSSEPCLGLGEARLSPSGLCLGAGSLYSLNVLASRFLGQIFFSS